MAKQNKKKRHKRGRAAAQASAEKEAKKSKEEAGPTGAGHLLDELAKRLVYRHLEVSLPDSFRQRFEFKRDIVRRAAVHQPSRTIAVVGAGASAPVFGRGMYLADEILRLDLDQPGLDSAIRRLSFDSEEAGNPVTFETALQAVARSPEGERRVRDHLVARYTQQFPVLYRYEVLAHLLKHRFLDAIISFNFDELLDRSIRDELGETSYRSVVSAQDALDGVFDPNDSQYLPTYFKPHGTASAPSTMKFTRESYFDMPPSISDAIGSVIGEGDCTILCLGYTIGPMDFAQLLRRPSQLSIFDLSAKPLETKAQKRIWRSASRDRRRVPTESAYHAIGTADPPADSPKSEARSVDQWWGRRNLEMQTIDRPPDLDLERIDDVDRWLHEMFEQIKKVTVEGAGGSTDETLSALLMDVRGVERHAVSSMLFGFSPEPGDQRTIRSCLHDRTLVEIALSVSRSQGVTTIPSLVNDRPHHYFARYRAAGGLRSFPELLRACGLEPATYPSTERRGFERVPDVWRLAPDRFLKSESSQRPSAGDPDSLESRIERAVGAFTSEDAVERAAALGGVAPELYRAGISQAQQISFSKLARQLVANLERTYVPGVPIRHQLNLGDWKPPKKKELAAPNDSAAEHRFFEALLKEVSRQPDAEIQAGSDAMCRAVYFAPVVLATHTAVKAAETRILDDAKKALKRGDQVRLDVAYIRGFKYLPGEDPHRCPYGPRITVLLEKEKFSLRVMVGDAHAYARWIKFKYDRGVPTDRIEVHYVPWYAHNRHGVLLSVKDRPSKAMYYGRRNLVAPIAPLYLWHRRDVRQVDAAFGLRRKEARGLTATMLEQRL